MKLEDIRRHARATAVQDLEVQWEKLDEDAEYRADFERILTECERIVPEIEQLYLRLQERKHVFNDDMDTSITYEQREEFLDRLVDELYASYQILDLWDRYQLVNRITSA